jgi:nicotinate-nucleotide adenylyltransferase
MNAKGIGIYAGTFDPVHNGHVTFALATARVCGLSKVIFLPERVPRNKSGVTNFAHRVAMIQVAIKQYPNLELQVLDSDQFSVKHTLPELQKMHQDGRLTLLVGSDNALSMNPVTWPGVEDIFQSTDIAVGMREGHSREQMRDLASKTQVYFVYTNHPHVAATKVRNGQFEMLHPDVLGYIKQHKLYKTG